MSTASFKTNKYIVLRDKMQSFHDQGIPFKIAYGALRSEYGHDEIIGVMMGMLKRNRIPRYMSSGGV